MRMSCNGCRVLRKGCSDNCSIRPCLEWIKNPESQANATVFLAKFYGRAGLMNLINAGPQHLRPAIFRSLLYEACGRIVNPIHGSVGLVWSGSWQLCQAAVEAVLKGEPITPMATDVAETKNVGPPLKAYDIRHVNKDDDNNNNNASGSDDLHKVRNRCRFKRSGQQKSSKRSRVCADDHQDESGTVAPKETKIIIRSPSHDESSLSHQSHEAVELLDEKVESESLGSADTTEPPARELDHHDGEIIELELTLGFEPPAKRSAKPKTPVQGACGAAHEDDGGFCKMELGLDYPAYAVMI